jgi:hypothetical protein
MNRIAHLLLMGLMAVPAEVGIRLVERRYGRNVRFVSPASNSDHLDWFLEDLRRDAGYDLLVAGSSASMYGLRPDILGSPCVGGHSAYNLSFSGVSFFLGLEIIRHLRLTPKQLVVSVSPFNFTRLAVERDRCSLIDLDRRIAGMTAVHPMTPRLRICDPRYDAALSNLAGSLGRGAAVFGGLESFGRCMAAGDDAMFLHDGRYTIRYVSSGFVGLVMERTWSAGDFQARALEPLEDNYRNVLCPDYRASGASLFARAEKLLEKLQAKGIGVVFVRLPQFAALRTLEDSETGFDQTMAAFAERLGIAYIDAQGFCPGFVSDPANFRDAAHLHEASAVPVSKWIAARVAAIPR